MYRFINGNGSIYSDYRKKGVNSLTTGMLLPLTVKIL